MNRIDRTLRFAVVVMLLTSPFAGCLPVRGATVKLYVVTHVDLTPNFTAEGTKLLDQFAAESRKDRGLLRFELLQDSARLNHFTIVEVWESSKAFEVHEEANHTKRFRDALQPMLGSPFDERLHHARN